MSNKCLIVPFVSFKNNIKKKNNNYIVCLPKTITVENDGNTCFIDAVLIIFFYGQNSFFRKQIIQDYNTLKTLFGLNSSNDDNNNSTWTKETDTIFQNILLLNKQYKTNCQEYFKSNADQEEQNTMNQFLNKHIHSTKKNSRREHLEYANIYQFYNPIIASYYQNTNNSSVKLKDYCHLFYKQLINSELVERNDQRLQQLYNLMFFMMQNNYVTPNDFFSLSEYIMHSLSQKTFYDLIPFFIQIKLLLYHMIDYLFKVSTTLNGQISSVTTNVIQQIYCLLNGSNNAKDQFNSTAFYQFFASVYTYNTFVNEKSKSFKSILQYDLINQKSELNDYLIDDQIPILVFEYFYLPMHLNVLQSLNSEIQITTENPNEYIMSNTFRIYAFTCLFINTANNQNGIGNGHYLSFFRNNKFQNRCTEKWFYHDGIKNKNSFKEITINDLEKNFQYNHSLSFTQNLLNYHFNLATKSEGCSPELLFYERITTQSDDGDDDDDICTFINN